MSSPLFDVPGADEVLSRSQKRNRLVEARIATGIHPLGYVKLHSDAALVRRGAGLTCGDCKFRVVKSYHNKVYAKCASGGGVRMSHSEASDVRSWWPACATFEAGE